MIRTLIAVLFLALSTSAQVLIGSAGYDNNRDALNASEHYLTTSNVNSTLFGKIATFTVDGPVFAQPLYIPGTPDMLIVATMNNSVYAFNADSLSNTPIWSVSLTNGSATPAQHTVTTSCVTEMQGFLDPAGNVGVLSTPVYDANAPHGATIFVVGMTRDGSTTCNTGTGDPGSATLNYRLHALALSNGAEQSGSPQIIAPSTVTGGLNNQRTGLAISNGRVYVGFASWGDIRGYNGVVGSFDEGTLTDGGFNDTPSSGVYGGIWMGGRAPVVDPSGNVYYSTGNGGNSGYPGITFGTQFGMSVIQFTNSATLTFAGWFTTDSAATLNAGDSDLGSSGVILVPGESRLLSIGKGCTIYVIDTSGNLGHHASGDAQLPQAPISVGDAEVTGSDIAFFNNTFYVWAQNGVLHGYAYNTSTHLLATSPAFSGSVYSGGSMGSGAFGPGMAISANGTSNGIVWADMPLGTNGGLGYNSAGRLYAMNAATGAELYDSDQAAANRDQLGQWGKFAPPVVDNGRVFVGSTGNAVVVYGLLAGNPATGATVSGVTLHNAVIQ